MHKKLSVLLFVLFFGISYTMESSAQVFCGTEAYRSPELIEFQMNGAQMPEMRSNEMMHVKTVVHVVGKDDGSGYVNADVLFRQACENNAVYNNFGINFYISEIRYINNSRYYNHDYTAGRQMMQQNNVAGAVNLYFVGDPAGACGYYMPATDAIAIKNGCLASGSITWPHELGHLFSLPHTFYGWEGTDYALENDTPASVGRVQTEKVDGSNCRQAGDGFCDTPPDYLSYRWPCDENKLSYVIQKDVNNERFKSDGTNMMSYSSDGCGVGFSDEQIAAIKYNIITTRRMNTSEPDLPYMDALEIENFSPRQDEKVYFDNVTFSWEPVEGAIGYLLEYTPLPNFNTMSTKVFITEPYYKPDTIYPFWTDIQWRVKPFGHRTVCVSEFGEIHNFSTVITSVNNAELQSDRIIYPNPANPHELLNIQSDSGFAGDVNVKIFDSTGKTVLEQNFVNNNNNLFSVNINHLQPGVHFVHLISKEGRSSHKVVIMP